MAKFLVDRVLTWVTAVFLFVLAGCGGEESIDRVPVSGQVTLNDQPVSSGNVEFHPVGESSEEPSIPVSTIGEDGKYSLATPMGEGAAPGSYKVVVRITEPTDPNDPYSPPKLLSPERYNNPDQTDLKIEVVPTPEPGAYDLKLQGS